MVKLHYPSISLLTMLFTTIFLMSCVIATESTEDPAGNESTTADGVRAEQPPESTGPQRIKIPGFLRPGPDPVPGSLIEAFYPVSKSERNNGDAPPGNALLLELVNFEGEVLSTSQGLIVELDDVEPFWYFILGFDSWMSPGRFILRLMGSESELLATYDITVRDREFRRVSIPLNRRLSVIRTDQSQERIRQSEKLSALLFTIGGDPPELLSNTVRRQPLDTIFYTSTFGDRRVFEYSDGSQATSIHHGLDFRAAIGEPVLTPVTGTVVMAEQRIVTGNTVVLRHLPGVYSLYYHLDELAVELGLEVETGDTLGRAGRTGLATGSHLHWEIRVFGTAVDPDHFMAGTLLDKELVKAIISGNLIKRW